MPTPHSSSRPPTRAICTQALVVLALCVTCSVYDDSLLATGQAGSAGSIAAGDGGGGMGSVAGSTPLPQGGAGKGGAATGGMGNSGGGSSGGKGGSAGSGGKAGSAGSMQGAAGEDNAGGAPTYELIDDMEDDNHFVLSGTERDGYWQTENDATVGSMQVPAMGQVFAMTDLADAASPREGSSFAAGMQLTGFVNSTWGALMVVSMRSTGVAIDGSAFCGLHFWAKRGTGNAELVLKVVDKHSSPLGGLCMLAQGNCYDDFHATVALTTEWSDYTVRFADLVQYGTGYQSPTGELDASAIHGIAFSVDEAPDFEVLIDDLAFVHNGGCPP